MKYNAILFDLDGTLIDSSEGVLKSIDAVISITKLTPLSLQEKLLFIGPPIQNSFKNRYGLDEDTTKKVAFMFRNIYKDRYLFDAEIYSGIINLLKYLQTNGIKIAVATNKREDYTEKLLLHFGIMPLIDVCVGSDFEGKLTKTDIIRSCLQKIGTESKTSVLIGDTQNDAIGAHEAGIDFIAVTYGFGFKTKEEGDNAGAVFTAESPDELTYFLLKNPTFSY